MVGKVIRACNTHGEDEKFTKNVGKHQGKNNLGNLDLCGRIVLKFILRK
jgi:hypothetical protein